MAKKFLNSNLYILWADLTTDPDSNATPSNYRPVACLVNVSFNGSTESIDVSNKCTGSGFADPEPGQSSWTIDFDGHAIDESQDSQRDSYQTLMEAWASKQKFFAKITNASNGEGTVVFREGVGFLSSFSESAGTNDVYAFSGTFTGKGNPKLAPTT